MLFHIITDVSSRYFLNTYICDVFPMLFNVFLLFIHVIAQCFSTYISHYLTSFNVISHTFHGMFHVHFSTTSSLLLLLFFHTHLESSIISQLNFAAAARGLGASFAFVRAWTGMYAL